MWFCHVKFSSVNTPRYLTDLILFNCMPLTNMVVQGDLIWINEAVEWAGRGSLERISEITSGTRTDCRAITGIKVPGRRVPSFRKCKNCFTQLLA